MMIFAYGAITLFGAPFQDASTNQIISLLTLLRVNTPRRVYPTTLNTTKSGVKFRLFPFRSPLLRELLRVSLSLATEIFNLQFSIFN